ncbi:MAG TPA: hypothetical protein VI757_06030 [Bacteroidia bacterium]|nr:hypothetical protein [Bacteroidia bacterium]
MKKFITLLLLASFVSVNSYSQTAARKYEYAIVDVYASRIYIDYGNNRNEDFKDVMKSKKKEKEYSQVDALNYMDEQGYELVSTIAEAGGGGATTSLKYIFKREIKK